MSLLLLDGDDETGLSPDAASSATTTGATSLTWAHTCSTSGDRLLVVGLSLLNALGQTVTGITYNGVALTAVPGGAISNGTGGRVELWYLIAPATGANNIVASFSASVAAVGGAESWVGADQTSPLGTAVTASGNTSDATVTVSGAVGQYIQDAVASAAVALTVGAGQTEEWNTGVTGLRGGGSREAGAASVVMDWTSALSALWAIAGVPVKPVAVGSTVAGSQATETDTANAGAIRIVINGSQATETDAANAGALRVAALGGQAAETDSAAAGAVLAVIAGSKASETDTANAGTARATVAGAQASESDTANPGALAVRLTGTQATEADTANAGGPNVTRLGTQAAETDAANVGTPRVVTAGARADETDSAQVGQGRIVKVGGQAIEVDTVAAGSLAVRVLGVLATEADSGFAGTSSGGLVPPTVIFGLEVGGVTFEIVDTGADFGLEVI